jgi:hypothetical protein
MLVAVLFKNILKPYCSKLVGIRLLLSANYDVLHSNDEVLAPILERTVNTP